MTRMLVATGRGSGADDRRRPGRPHPSGPTGSRASPSARRCVIWTRPARGADLRLPELARYELASGLTRLVVAGVMPARHCTAVWEQIEVLPLTYHRLGDGARVVAIARSLDRSSAYAAAYLALGEELDSAVWTLDARLYRNASARGYAIRLLEDGTADR